MTATAAPARPAGRPARQAGRWLLHGTGELLFTAGVVLLLFVAYQLVWTDVLSARQTRDVQQGLDRSWADGRAPDFADPRVTAPGPLAPAPLPGAAGPPLATPRTGQAIGFIHIPRLGADYRKPIVQGVGLDQLAEGVGHYRQSALPGQVGNFAVAGHRATHGEPFRYLNELRVGDAVVVETRDAWITYRVQSTETVLPDHTAVLYPVPEHRGRRPTQALLTMTTCTPRATSTHRLIVYASLESAQSKSAGRPAALAPVG